MEEIANELRTLNLLLCTFTLEMTEASLSEARDQAKRWGGESSWNADVDKLSMRFNRLRKLEKRLLQKHET